MKRTLRRILWVGVALIGLLLLWAAVELLRGPVEPVREQMSLEQPLFESPLVVAPVPAGAPDEGGSRATAGAVPGSLRAWISLEEGEFRIDATDERAFLRIDADYDSASYVLDHELEKPPEEAPRLRLTFRRRISLVRFLLGGLGHERSVNRVRVGLPRGVRLDLTLELSRGNHVVDLSGLSVSRLAVRTSMGETEISFREPNPVELGLLEVDARMGELRLSGLGHADAREVEVRGAMGEQRIDFGGTARGATSASIRMTMGSAYLLVPEGRPLRIEDSSALMGEVDVGRGVIRGESAEAPSGPAPLSLDLRVRMGELTVR